MESPRPKTVSESWRTSADYRRLRDTAYDGGRPVTFVNGCFDLFHSGHVKLLHFAAAESARRAPGRSLGPLVVGLNTDNSVHRLKGAGRPVLPWYERAAVLAAVGVVDAVVGFDEDTPFDLVADLKPFLLVKGSDYATKPVPEAAALPPGGSVVFRERHPCESSSSWVYGRVILSEATRAQEGKMLLHRMTRLDKPHTEERTDGSQQ